MSSHLDPSTPNDFRSAQLGCCPLVFSNMIQEWEAAQWTPNHLASLAGDSKFNCRLHCRHCFQKSDAIQWENDCFHVKSSVTEFLTWIKEGKTNNLDPDENHPGLAAYNPETYWCYLDYTSLGDVVPDEAVINKAINWNCFGLDEDTPFQNYVWLGSQGAHTPCHYDTYGFNLVAQIYGSKRWILFPPEDTENLYPTRIPYEESSVYSDVNIKNPDFIKHPKFKNSHPHEIILKAGQVLYVPWKWWHFVECLETSLSINNWLQLPEDNMSRVEESITRMIFSKWMTFTKNSEHWLNPNEDIESDEINAGYLSQTLYSLGKLSKYTKDSAETESTKKTTDDATSQATFGSPEVMSSSFDSERNHLEKFLICLEKILKNYPLKLTTRSKCSSSAVGSSVSSTESKDVRSEQPYHAIRKSDDSKDYIEKSSDESNIKKRRLTSSLSEEITATDDHSIVLQISPCPIDKLWEYFGHSVHQCQTACSFHAKKETTPKVDQLGSGPLPGEFVEEELLRKLLEPDIVALLTQKLRKRYLQELDDHSKKK